MTSFRDQNKKSVTAAGVEYPTSFFPSVPDDFLGNFPPTWLRVQQLQFGHYR